jgi:hypothetical protein
MNNSANVIVISSYDSLSFLWQTLLDDVNITLLLLKHVMMIIPSKSKQNNKKSSTKNEIFFSGIFNCGYATRLQN